MSIYVPLELPDIPESDFGIKAKKNKSIEEEFDSALVHYYTMEYWWQGIEKEYQNYIQKKRPYTDKMLLDELKSKVEKSAFRGRVWRGLFWDLNLPGIVFGREGWQKFANQLRTGYVEIDRFRSGTTKKAVAWKWPLKTIIRMYKSDLSSLQGALLDFEFVKTYPLPCNTYAQDGELLHEVVIPPGIYRIESQSNTIERLDDDTYFRMYTYHLRSTMKRSMPMNGEMMSRNVMINR